VPPTVIGNFVFDLASRTRSGSSIVRWQRSFVASLNTSLREQRKIRRYLGVSRAKRPR
jgi:hypothetical protein